MLKQKRGNNKRKVIVSLSLVCLVFVAVITAVILINAFPNQAFGSSIKVSYSAKDISAEVSAWYQEKTGTKTYLTTTKGGTETVLQLKASDNGETAKELHMDKDITLTSSNNYAVFCYEFKNTGSRTFAGVNSFEPTIAGEWPENFLITFSLDGVNYNSSNAGFSAAKNDLVKYYVKVEVENLAFDATIDGVFSWDLNNYVKDTDQARIGTTSYSTVQEAVDASSSGDIVALSSNVEVDSLTLYDGTQLIADKDVTITTTEGIIASAAENEVSASSVSATTNSSIFKNAIRIGSENGGKITIVQTSANLAITNDTQLLLTNVDIVSNVAELTETCIGIYNINIVFAINTNISGFYYGVKTEPDKATALISGSIYNCTTGVYSQNSNIYLGYNPKGYLAQDIYYDEVLQYMGCVDNNETFYIYNCTNRAMNIIGYMGASGSSYGVVIENLVLGKDKNGNAAPNSSSQIGGAAYLKEMDVYIFNLDCANNHSDDMAGGIYFEYCDVRSYNYSNITFENNSSSTFGGAVAITLNNYPRAGHGAGHENYANFYNAKFIGNTATNNGGAIYVRDVNNKYKNVYFYNSTFSGNKATGDGGVLMANCGNIVLSGCEISGNSTENKGGAFILLNAKSYMESSKFYNNTASVDGGVFNLSGATITLNNTEIYSNTAAGEGGAIVASGSTLDLNGNVNIHNNSAKTYGGAISMHDSTLNMRGGEISNNQLSNPGSWINKTQAYGGAISIYSGATFNMYAGTIKNNKASATYSFGGNVHIDKNAKYYFYAGTIEGDSSVAAMLGGGVSVLGEFFLYGGTIKKCGAEIGGGVMNLGTATMTSGLISECVASNDANNNGKAVANNGTLNLGNVTLGSGQDIAMGYQKVSLASSVFPESYGVLNVTESLGYQYTITFIQVTGTASANVGNGTKAIEKFTSGTVFATYLNGALAHTNNFTTSGYTFYVSNGNMYMKAAA